MDEFSKEVFKEEKRTLAKYFLKLPKLLRWVLFFLYTIIPFILGFVIGKYNINLNNFIQKGAYIININKVEGTSTINVAPQISSCSVKFCSDFKDGLWQYEDRFVKIQDDPLILKSPHTSALPGATMFYNEAIGNFTAETFITPEASTSANLVVAYGHFVRCIIGDGDYTKVSCQVNGDYPKAIESWSYIDKDGQLHGRYEQHQISPFSPNQELQLQFGLEKVGTSTVITIKLNDQVPLEWKLPKSFEGKTQIEKVGVGLFTTNFDDVQAVFKKFQLDPHI